MERHEVKVGSIPEYLYGILEKCELVERIPMLSAEEKKELVYEAMHKLFFGQCVSRFDDYTVSRVENGIKIVKTAFVKISGENSRGENITKQIEVPAVSLILSNHNIENDTMEYDMELVVDTDEETLLSKVRPRSLEVFANYNMGTSSKELLALKNKCEPNFWHEKLPKRLSTEQNKTKALLELARILYERKLANITGNELVSMRALYHEAVKLFPMFAELPEVKRLKVMNQAGLRSHAISVSGDVTLYAKAICEAIIANELYEKLIIRGKEYTKTSEVRHDRIVDTGFYCDIKRELVEKNAIKTISYEHRMGTELKSKTSFTPFDLWNMLAKKWS